MPTLRLEVPHGKSRFEAAKTQVTNFRGIWAAHLPLLKGSKKTNSTQVRDMNKLSNIDDLGDD